MDLRTRAVKSVGWLALSRLWAQAVSWAVTIVLARLLVPADYGLFAMAMAIIHFLDLFQGLGLGAAIVQRREIARPQLNALFWTSMGAGLLLLAAAWLAAPLAVSFYAEPRLAWMVRVLALTFLVSSLAMVSHSLLTREIDFRRRSVAEGLSTVVGAVTAIALAWSGHGVWALVWGHLTRAVARTAMLMAFARWRPGLEVSSAGLRSALSYGLHFTGAGLVDSVVGLVTTAIVGRGLGGAALGLYGMADSLGRTAINKISISVINQASFPLFSRLQDDPAQLRAYFLKISKYLALIAFPVQLGLFLVGRDLVIVLLTERWLGMLQVFQVFALGGIVYVQSLPAAPLLNARGRVRTTFWLSVGKTCGTAVGAAAGVPFGLLGVGIGTMAAAVLARVTWLGVALSSIRLAPAAYARTIAAPAGAALVMAAVVLGVRAALGTETAPLERLVWSGATGGLAYVGTLLLLDRGLGSEMRGIVQRLVAPSGA